MCLFLYKVSKEVCLTKVMEGDLSYNNIKIREDHGYRPTDLAHVRLNHRQVLSRQEMVRFVVYLS